MKILLSESQLKRVIKEQGYNTLPNLKNPYANSYVPRSNDNIPKISPEQKQAQDRFNSPVGKGIYPNEYPRCVQSENHNLWDTFQQTDGKWFLVMNEQKFSEYRFYTDGTVYCPDGKMRKYSCNQGGYEPLIDGKEVEVVDQQWAKEKGNYTTDYERNELKKMASQAVAMDKFGKNVVDPVAAFYQKHNHGINTILQIGTSFIPVVGPFISAGIGLADAKQYYDEGHHKEAGIVGVLSLLPGCGQLIGKIPKVAALGEKGMAAIGLKLMGNKALTKIEEDVVISLTKETELVKTALAGRIQQLATSVQGNISKLPPLTQKIINNAAKGAANYVKSNVREKSVRTSFDLAGVR